MKIVDRSWSDEDMELVREAFGAKVIRLGKLLHDSGNTDDKHSQRIRHEFYTNSTRCLVAKIRYDRVEADIGGRTNNSNS
jgi:hypothetical protein